VNTDIKVLKKVLLIEKFILRADGSYYEFFYEAL